MMNTETYGVIKGKLYYKEKEVKDKLVVAISNNERSFLTIANDKNGFCRYVKVCDGYSFIQDPVLPLKNQMVISSEGYVFYGAPFEIIGYDSEGDLHTINCDDYHKVFQKGCTYTEYEELKPLRAKDLVDLIDDINTKANSDYIANHIENIKKMIKLRGI